MHAVRLSFCAATLRVAAARPVCASIVRCALPPVARTSFLASSPSFVHAALRRSFAVTANNFERRDNTAELLDFEAGRRDPIKWRKQLMYRSKQRGWLELDLIMGTWADENLQKLSVPQLEEYAYIVASENPDLIKSFVENLPLPAHLEGNEVAKQLVEYAQRHKKQWCTTVESGNQ